MDLALIAGGDKQIALAVERHRPDVFRLRDRRRLQYFPPRRHDRLCHRAQSRHRHDPPVNGDRLDLQPGQFRDSPCLARRVDYMKSFAVDALGPPPPV